MRRRLFGPRGLDINRDTPPVIQRAHELLAIGNYAEAAMAFEKLAQYAEAKKGPRTPFFYLQAGHARIMLMQTAAGMEDLRHGLDLLATYGFYNQLYRAGNRTVRELRARGLENEAKEIASLIQHSTPAIAESPTQGRPNSSRAALPARCPACGGPVRSDEVNWIDAATAECTFCGSPLPAEE